MSQKVPFAKDHRPEHQVIWRDKQMFMSPTTVGIKKQFCQWLLKTSLASATEALDPKDLAVFRKDLFAAPPAWGVVPSAEVQASFNTTEGQMMISRLLLNVGPDEMDDQDLLTMMAEKAMDPTSDYIISLAVVSENSDPKVKTGLVTSTPTVSTP